jgi:Ras-related protein Rab-1A
LIGNAGVGKTVAAKSFADGKPNATSQYKATIGVDYALREISIGHSTASIQIWDIAGEQRFGTMTKTYFRGAHAVIIMFDLTNMVSWEDVDIWRQDALGKLGVEGSSNRVPVLVVGNKVDLVSGDKPSVVSDSDLAAYIKTHNLWKSVKISAKTDNVFGETVKELTEMIHSTAPTKATSDSPKTREGSLKVLPSSSSPSQSQNRHKRDESPKTSKPRSTSVSERPPVRPEPSTDEGVYTHTENNSNSERSDCCTIS